MWIDGKSNALFFFIISHSLLGIRTRYSTYVFCCANALGIKIIAMNSCVRYITRSAEEKEPAGYPPPVFFSLFPIRLSKTA